MFLVARGQFGESLDVLQMVTSRFHELDDASSVLSSLYLRGYLRPDQRRRRAVGRRAPAGPRDVLHGRGPSDPGPRQRGAGAARAPDGRGAGAGDAERGDDALERRGTSRAAAVARRDLGELAAGRRRSHGRRRPRIRRSRRCCGPTRLAAGPALAEIAAAVAPDQAERAGLLAGAARHVMRTAPGTEPGVPRAQSALVPRPAAHRGAAGGRRCRCPRWTTRRWWPWPPVERRRSEDRRAGWPDPQSASPTPGSAPPPPSAVW